jgi:hypothetical protein
MSNQARHRGTLLKLSQATPRAITNTKAYCHFSPTTFVALA